MSRREFSRPQGPLFCPLDGYPLEFGTNGAGGVREHCRACERRRAHRCMDCGIPVHGRAWRCAIHRDAAKRRAWQIHEQRYREERNAADRARYRRRRRKDPAAHRARLEQKRAWRQANPKRVAMHKRRGRLAGTNGYASREKYLAYQTDYNAARREEKRQKERERYYRLHPERPAATCLECGAPVGWTGKGRPAKRCPAHNPWKKVANG